MFVLSKITGFVTNLPPPPPERQTPTEIRKSRAINAITFKSNSSLNFGSRWNAPTETICQGLIAFYAYTDECPCDSSCCLMFEVCCCCLLNVIGLEWKSIHPKFMLVRTFNPQFPLSISSLHVPLFLITSLSGIKGSMKAFLDFFWLS